MRRKACMEVVALILLLLIVAFILGSSAAGGHWRTEIVKHGCGRWVVNDAGKTTFEWVEMCEGTR